MRLALFGGTFDPIHNGHLTIAEAAVARWDLAHVLFIPAGRPPHKATGTHAGYEHRLRMVALACRDRPRFQPSDLEAGSGKSYSIDTIEKVRSGLDAGDRLYFLIGADAFSEIETWRRWQDVVASVDFIVVSRPGHRYAIPEGARVERLDDLDLPISSSEIRRKLARGDYPVDVPAPVLEYIREHGLYRP